MVSAIYPIVEGRGEVRAVPILLRRFAFDVYKNFAFHVLEPYRLPRGRMLTEGHLEQAVEFAARKLQQQEGSGAIFVLLDANDDCPAKLGPALLDRVTKARTDRRASVVIAKSEYEAWFLAAARSLRRVPDVSDNAEPPEKPEAIRDAKRFLERNLMVEGARYSETVDQPRFTAMFDFDEAAACPSFKKLRRDIADLFSG